MEKMMTQKKVRMRTSLERYKKLTLKVLNDSLAWNIAKLPNNTFDLQLAKYEEEVNEAIEAEGNYEHFIEELADVLISIGGMARFDPGLSQEMLNKYMGDLDKFIFMDVVDYTPTKLKILYERDYSNGYHH